MHISENSVYPLTDFFCFCSFTTKCCFEIIINEKTLNSNLIISEKVIVYYKNASI